MQPFSEIKSFGIPYHGLVTDSELQLPNNQKISYSLLTSGDTQLVAIPNCPTVYRTPEQQAFDRAHGLEWRNYAIVADNHLGAANLGLDWLLYIDANQVVWYIKLGYHIIQNRCLMSCTLQSVFGRFNPNYKTVSRMLAQEETHFNLAGKLKPINRFTFERKPDGTEVLIHVYAKFEGENTIEFPEEMSLYEVWKIELKGNGLLNFDESIGNGITATITKHLSYEAIQSSHIRNIPKQEKRFRLGKVNIQGRYEPKHAEPPECASNTYHETFDLALMPEGDDFIPFRHDQNTYLQSDWYGAEEIKNATVRMLYDKDGITHTFGIQRVIKRQNKLHQKFEGYGTGERGPINYYFNGFSCVLNGFLPGLIEQYEGLQTVKSHFRIVHEASLLLDNQVVNKMSLEGEVAQIAETVVEQPVVNSVNVKIQINDEIVRDVSDKPGQTGNDIISNPFSGYFKNDDANGVFAKFYFGFASNNLIGQLISRFKSSQAQKSFRSESYGIAGIKNQHIESKPLETPNMHGSWQPISCKIATSFIGVQSWA